MSQALKRAPPNKPCVWGIFLLDRLQIKLMVACKETAMKRECDCCGEMKSGCVNTTTGGSFPMDVTACPKCRGANEIACDNCGEEAEEWDWSPSYDRFCLECLGIESDTAADRGCHEYHQRTAQ
jgi:hypothetical protein